MDLLQSIVSLVITAAIAVPLVVAAVLITQLIRIARSRRESGRVDVERDAERAAHDDPEQHG